MQNIHSYRFPFAKYPAVRIVILIISGIIFSKYFTVEAYIWASLLASVLILFLFGNFGFVRNLTFQSYHFSIGCYLVALFLFGAYWHSSQSYKTEPFFKAFLDTLAWEKGTFEGEIYQIRKTSTGNFQLDIAIDTTRTSDSNLLLERYILRAVLREKDSVYTHNIKPGNRIYFDATIYPISDKRNPHEFDYKNYLSSKKIYVQAGVDTLLRTTQSKDLLSWNQLRQHTISIIDQNFSPKTAPVAKALIIGYKNELTKDEKTAFSRVGLSHIMAVSGLHVGFLLAPFWLLIPFFWTYKYGREAGLVILIVLLFFYAGLTGFSASVTRASITGGFIIYARLFNKMRDSINLTAMAAIFIILIDPEEIFEIGFQLSFSAVYIILLVLPIAANLLPSRLRYSKLGSLISIILVSIVVQAGLFPILSFYFGEFSIIGPLANTLVVPFLGFILPYALVALGITILAPEIGFFLNMPCEYFLQGLNYVVMTLAAWDLSWIQTQEPGVLLFMIWFVIIFFISSSRIPIFRWKLLITLLTILVFHQGLAIIKMLKVPKLEVTVLDVGQGDAALIKTPLGKNILIDAGRWTPGYNSGRFTLLPHLKAEGITKLDAVFLSHPHADHIGGILDLIDNVPIGIIYNSGFSYDSDLYRNYISLASEKGVPVRSLAAGTLLKPDPSIRILVYGPEESADDSDPNERSLILEIIYGSTEFLFMGDAGEKQEMRLLNNYGNLLDTDFLKVGHHGSRTSSSTLFLNAAGPDISVVSLDKNNKFRHPHKEAVGRLHRLNTSLYYTGLEGALIFNSNGSIIRRIYWK
ncbi:MAG: DNA internalization-related competence protein ComEC/Rec2 [Candidatus Halalkalibacterium sp. M3_1C_030]